MIYLTGRYQDSLEALLTTSIWIDVADVLIWYRTVGDRLEHLRRGARRRRIRMTIDEVDTELSILAARAIPELGEFPLGQLANNVLHHSWHPDRSRSELHIYIEGEEKKSVRLVRGADIITKLGHVVEETRIQFEGILQRLT
jgi:hypothetical protein